MFQDIADRVNAALEAGESVPESIEGSSGRVWIGYTFDAGIEDFAELPADTHNGCTLPAGESSVIVDLWQSSNEDAYKLGVYVNGEKRAAGEHIVGEAADVLEAQAVELFDASIEELQQQRIEAA